MASAFPTALYFHLSASQLLNGAPSLSYFGKPRIMRQKKVVKCNKEVELEISSSPDYVRKRELKAFDDTKAGVKGLLEAGVEKLPEIFVHKHKLHDEKCGNSKFQTSIPVIDIKDANNDPLLNLEIIDKIRAACENWGFFQVVNHGVPIRVMDEMIERIRMFHEQDAEMKRPYYTRDSTKNVVYNSNYDLYESSAALWKDTFTCKMAPLPPRPEELPVVFRDISIEYSNEVMGLGIKILRLMAESLGLKENQLVEMGCAEGFYFKGHYYPPCPQPELTFGMAEHTDIGFLTILLQDQIGGLQVLHQDEWVDVPCLPGAFVIFLGDLSQLITNGRYKSVFHRVIAKRVGPRISVASFLRAYSGEFFISRLYGPIKELISQENPPIYKDTTIEHYSKFFLKKNKVGNSALTYFKL